MITKLFTNQGKKTLRLMHFLEGITLHAFSIPQAQLWDDLCQSVSTEPYMQKVDKLAAENPGQPYNKNLLYFKQCIVIPHQSKIIQQLLHEFHNSPSGGHSGIQRSFK